VPQAPTTGLTILVDGGTRRLGLRRIEAVAVGGVLRPGDRAVIVVDLMLDSPGRSPRPARGSSADADFDPGTLAPGGDAQEAFRALLSRIIDLSGAAPLPDPDGARGRPIRTFASLEEYERSVLRGSKNGGGRPGPGSD
jgi:hypothetical protein